MEFYVDIQQKLYQDVLSPTKEIVFHSLITIIS